MRGQKSARSTEEREEHSSLRLPTTLFCSQSRRFGIGFAIDLHENKPYGQHESESWDFSKNNDVNELFEMIAFERPIIVTGSPSGTAFLNFKT